jgi:hypothetical protein
MEPNNDPFRQTGAQIQEPDIPVLKAKKEEKKGAGFIVPGAAAPGAAPLIGGAGMAAGKGGMLALLSGKLGIAAAMLGIGGAGLVGYGMLGQSSQAPKATPQLASPDSMVANRKRNAQGSKSLSFMQKAAEGELKWDKNGAPVKDAAGADPASEDVAEADGANEGEGMPNAEDLLAGAEGVDGVQGDDKPRLSGGLSGNKLSSSLGGGFGKKNIFGGGGGVDLKKLSALGGKTKKLEATRRTRSASRKRKVNGLLAKKISTRGIGANRAMGQLKFAGRRSGQAAAAGEAGAQRTYATDAFTQGQTNDGAAGEIGGGINNGEVGSLGSGAPDVTDTGSSDFEPPTVDEGENVTNYQGLVDSSKGMVDTAITLAIVGGVILAAGIAIMAASSWTGIGAVIGAILAAIGAMLLVLSLIMSNMAADQGDMIRNYGQEDQADIINRRADNANEGMEEGCSHEGHCNLDETKWDNTIQQDVAEERDATYE